MELIKSSKKQPVKRRSRKKPQEGNSLTRIGIRFGIFLAVIVCLGVVKILFDKVFYTENPHFTLKEIKIETPSKAVEKKYILNKLDLQEGHDNIYDIDIEEVRKTLETDSQIMKADVRRIVPDTLSITIYGRTARAQLLRVGGYLLDEEGIVLPANRHPESRKLPIITGVQGVSSINEGVKCEDIMVQHALQLLQYISVMDRGDWLRVKRIICSPRTQELIVHLDAYPEKGIGTRGTAELILPVKNMDKALSRVMDILIERDLAGQTTSYVHTGYDRIPVRN